MERNLVKAVIVLSSDGVYGVWTCFFVPAACGRETSFALEFLFPSFLPSFLPSSLWCSLASVVVLCLLVYIPRLYWIS